MDQTRVQELLNNIEDEGREAVHKWYEEQLEKGRENDICHIHLESRVQFYAADIAENALGFALDEDDCRTPVGEVMQYCYQEDAAHAAKESAK